MVEWPTLLLLGGTIAVSNAIQTMTGFGSIVIALTLGALWVPIADLKLVLMLLSLPLCAIPIAKHPAQVDLALLRTRIAPLMGLGLLVGMVAAPYVPGAHLRFALGGMVLALACRDLLRLLGVWTNKPAEALLPAWMVGAGVVQGVLASGGPLLVRALATVKMDRSRFRTTLLVVWLVSNVLMLAAAVVQGQITRGHLVTSVLLSPAVLVGIAAGERLHAHVSQRQFELVVQAGLVVSGLALLL